jgi:hypothetical protein
MQIPSRQRQIRKGTIKLVGGLYYEGEHSVFEKSMLLPAGAER